MAREHQRPLLHPSADFDRLVGSNDPGAQQRIAQETSWAILHRVRETSSPEIVERVVQLARSGTIDDMAELWSSASAHSLAGMLWRLYLLRRVAQDDPAGTAEMFRRGSALAETIDPVVAGAADPVTPESIVSLCDTILRSVFRGDLADALDRSASYCRLMALGAASLADSRDAFDDAHAAELTTRALRYETFARELRAGARRWRDGSLD